MIVVVRIPGSSAIARLACSLEGNWRASAGQFGRIAAAALAFFIPTKIVDSQEPLLKVGPGKAWTRPLDPRVVRLSAFFQAYNCPEPHHINAYLRAADAYGLDYRLLPAISLRETTCGVTEKNNNRWGYHPGRQSFPSVEAGINFLARHLAEEPPYAGKTLRQKLFTYNPLPAYPGEIQRLMRQIE